MYIYIYRYINVVSSELFDIFFVWRSLCSRIFPKYHANETLWFVAKDGGWWKGYVRQGLSSFSDDDEDVLAAFFGTNQRNLHQQKHSLHNKTPARFTISSINKKTNSNPPGKKMNQKTCPERERKGLFSKRKFHLPTSNSQFSGFRFGQIQALPTSRWSRSLVLPPAALGRKKTEKTWLGKWSNLTI